MCICKLSIGMYSYLFFWVTKVNFHLNKLTFTFTIFICSMSKFNCTLTFFICTLTKYLCILPKYNFIIIKLNCRVPEFIFIITKLNLISSSMRKLGTELCKRPVIFCFVYLKHLQKRYFK